MWHQTWHSAYTKNRRYIAVPANKWISSLSRGIRGLYVGCEYKWHSTSVATHRKTEATHRVLLNTAFGTAEQVATTVVIQHRCRPLYGQQYLLTYSMVQSPSWEANWFPASQDIPRIFMEPEGSLPHSDDGLHTGPKHVFVYYISLLTVILLCSWLYMYIDIYTLQLCITDLTQQGWHTSRIQNWF